MYIPKHFIQNDEVSTRLLVDSYSFGLLVTTDNGGLPVASHIPFLSRESEGEWVIEGHVARSNEQSAHIRQDAPALAVFRGPHAYVSPTWYEAPGVPTWNYAAVHIYGRLQEVTGDGARSIIERLAGKFEGDGSNAWVPAYPETMLDGIVCFSMAELKVQSKSKMSQNRSTADRAGVIEALSMTEHPDALAVCQTMRDNESRRK